MKTVGFGKNCKVQLHSSRKPYMELVQERVAHLELQHCEDAFFLADLGDIVKKYEKWMELLPRVEPFYAVKCNNDPAVLKLLAHLGVGFDCASKDEISRVLRLGVRPSRIVYANPCKQNSFIRYAAKEKVDLMTFDNEAELYKIKNAYPTARLVLRILPPANFKVQCELGNKFGCHPSDARCLLRKAKEHGLNVVGISFHVGSGVEEAEAFSAAVETAAQVFNEGQALGFDFDLLDIGGGFPGHSEAPVTFKEIATVLNKALNKHFPPKRNVRIIAEPGRYFVASAFSITVNIIAKRLVTSYLDKDMAENDKDGKGAFMYYVNDGVYGSFNSLLYDHASVEARLVNAPVNPMEFVTSVWGPTCDGLDQILKNAKLPELDVGEFINFPDMGAYTLCAGSTFNGMPRPDMFYHCSENIWNTLFPSDLKVPEPSSPITKSLPILKAGHQLEKVEIDVLSASPTPVCVLDEEEHFFN
ncbi:ornithine decarboxylase-like [Littorina saxatilis]|uniref:ornithine decarboxylase n=1 Tax=Littorina saxatilis TaxID=31220 RepID=A0AAN9G9L7_9CAEN